MGFFDKLKNGLTKTRESIAKQVNNVFSVFVKVDDELFENLEEALIMADIGVETSTYIIEKLRDNVKHKHITDGNLVKEELKSIISEILSTLDTTVDTSTTPSVILVIGVNGVGKQQVSEKSHHIISRWVKRYFLRRLTHSERRR